MESILTTARLIQLNYIDGNLKNLLGSTDKTNIQDEQVQNLDEIANTLALHYLKESQQVIQVVTEEVENPIELNSGGRYFVYLDPLDGSSNIKHSLPVGFMFGIAKRNLEGPEDNHLRPAKEFIAAGIFIIPSGIFTFALRDSGAYRFVIDQSGNYIRPKKLEIGTNSKNWELSFNASNTNFFNPKITDWLNSKVKDYNFRYSGSLAVDFHRLIDNGGMFLYPAITRHSDPKQNRPDGKLRLLYEAAVVAFIAKEAKGKAINEQGIDIIEVQPILPHQRTTLFVGNPDLIKNIRQVLKGKL